MLPALAAVLLSGLATPQVTHWEVRSHVVLPRPMWLVDGVVLQPRVTEVELDLALACATPEDRPREVRCIVEDAAIRAAAMPGEEEIVGAALAQADERLTGAEIVVSTKQGRVRGVLLDIDEPQGSLVRRASRARDENLRLLVSRAMAGFDLQQGALDEGGAWAQRRSWLAQLPGGRGTLASSTLAHEVRTTDEGGYQVVTGGKASLVVETLFRDGTPAPEDTFRADIRADARLDDAGALISRRWGLVAEPTPSSGGGQGVIALPYTHTGTLTRIETASDATIGETTVIPASSRQPGALQADRSLGIPPTAFRGL